MPRLSQEKLEIEHAKAESLNVIARAAQDATAKVAMDAGEALKVVSAARLKATGVSDKKTADNEPSGFMSFVWKQLSLALSIIGVLFAGFIYLTNPAKDNDTALQLQDARITDQSKTIDGLNLTLQNDTKELKNEVSGLRTELQVQTIEITKLATIISERLPVNKNIQ
jgi:hypothetical protein